jgi:hypothetical protein
MPALRKVIAVLKASFGVIVVLALLEAAAAAKESDVMIYSIGTFDRYVSIVEEVRGPELLSEIAEPTGGRAFTLDNPREMPAVARHIRNGTTNPICSGLSAGEYAA